MYSFWSALTPVFIFGLVLRDIFDSNQSTSYNHAGAGRLCVGGVSAAPASGGGDGTSERRVPLLFDRIPKQGKSTHAGNGNRMPVAGHQQQPGNPAPAPSGVKIPPLVPVEWPPAVGGDVARLYPLTELPPTDWTNLIVPNPSPVTNHNTSATAYNNNNNNNNYRLKPSSSESRYQTDEKGREGETDYRLRPGLDMAVVADHIKCYSCMSKFYQANWQLLQGLYNRPRNFTDSCDFDPDRPNAQRHVGLVSCNSVCIKMYEQSQIGGLYVNGFTRGCYDSMMRRGFNATLVKWYRWLQRDSCHEYSRREVLQLGHNAPDGIVTICTCYADGCNGSPRLSAAAGWVPPILRWSTYVSIALYVGWLRT